MLGNSTITPVEAVYEAYLDWFDTQEGYPNHKSISWIKNIAELNKMRAPGNTCLRSLQSKTMGTVDTRINNSKGCGSVMRIAPCALIANSAIEAARLATACGAITHGHTLALMPCHVCASMIYSLLFDNVDIEMALQIAVKNLKMDKAMFNDKPIYFKNSNLTIFTDLINEAVSLSKRNLSDTQAIRMLGEGWTAEEAFAIALYACLKYPNSFEDAVVCAVNHDGDSDSTGAIAGNIIGAFLGLSSIPLYYTDNVELKDITLELAEDMLLARQLHPDTPQQPDASWERKYCDCHYDEQ